MPIVPANELERKKNLDSSFGSSNFVMQLNDVCNSVTELIPIEQAKEENTQLLRVLLFLLKLIFNLILNKYKQI